MTVLVTGGAGYIGSQMVCGLIDAGERAIVLDNLSTGHRSAVAAGVPLVVGESGDQALVSRLIREHDVEAIIHFAASLIVPDSLRDPLGYYRNNTVNSRTLIECAIESGVRQFIFLPQRRSTAIRRQSRPTRRRRRCRFHLTAGRN
jgi:UDP-glucose 4-epimerase